MEIRADKRSIQAHREPAAEQALTDGLADLRQLQLRLAKALARIEASAHFVFSGCASVIEYAMQRGYSPFEARTLLGLGKTIDAAPDAEQRVHSGELTVEAASAVGRILAHPELVAGPKGSSQAGWDAGDWLDTAATDSFKSLQRRIKQHIEMHAQNETGIEEVTVHVTARTKDDFARAQEVASQKAGKPLSEGQAFHRVVNFYLDKNDPLRAKSGTRRLGPTRERPGDVADPTTRYVPAAVRRAVWQRAGGACEVGGCSRRLGLELAHRSPHARGSAREVEDLGLLCRRHHLLYDAGRLAWPVVDPEDGAGDRGRVRGFARRPAGEQDAPPRSASPGGRAPPASMTLGPGGGGASEVRERGARLLAFGGRARTAV